MALSTAYRGTALLLGDVIEADDEYTGSHSRDVVDLSVAVAAALALDPQRRQNVEFGALLHDVGKIRIPKEILNKRGKLTEEETELVRRHTIDGQRMLDQPIHLHFPVREILLHVRLIIVRRRIEGAVGAEHRRDVGFGVFPRERVGAGVPV